MATIKIVFTHCVVCRNFLSINKLFYLIILFFTCKVSVAQNLVPNSSFEQFNLCPVGFGEINKAIDWNSPLFSTTPDYFNACNTNTNVDVPQNTYGYESARTGNAYAGVVTFHIQQQTTQQRDYREYLQCQLMDTLNAGVKYFISWYVSACDSCNYVCNNMGMLLSTTQINDTCTPNQCNLNYLPQIENPVSNNLNNRNGWTQISGTYLAIGGEKYIIIGNFGDTSGSSGSYTGWGVQLGSDLNYIAFYFIDDICVSTDSLTCLASTGIREANHDYEIIVFPNPISNKINIRAETNEFLEVNLYDITGRKIFNQSFKYSISINTEQLGTGVYVYEVKSKGGVIRKGKVVKD